MRRVYDFIQDSARWEHLTFRDGDVVISTPAKCGTTWMQRLVSLVLGVEPTPDRPMAVISPWLDMLTRPIESVVADLEAQQHRRFIKSHTPLDALPFDARVTYITVGRDPRDVAMSWAHHYDNMDMDVLVGARAASVGLDDLAEVMPDGPPPPPPSDPVVRFWEWVEGTGAIVIGLRRLLDHQETFWARRHEPNVHLFHYGDLKADLTAQVRRLGDVLGVALDDARVAHVVEQAQFERMRERATELAPNAEANLWKETAGFFHRGTSGQWRDLLTDDDVVRYEKVVGGLEPADLVRWLHTGGPAV